MYYYLVYSKGIDQQMIKHQIRCDFFNLKFILFLCSVDINLNYFVEMSWKGPMFAQGLWPLERPARWTKPFIGQGIKEMLATKVNRYK